jgi:hypothetical protein
MSTIGAKFKLLSAFFTLRKSVVNYTRQLTAKKYCMKPMLDVAVECSKMAEQMFTTKSVVAGQPALHNFRIFLGNFHKCHA